MEISRPFMAGRDFGAARLNNDSSLDQSFDLTLGIFGLLVAL